MVKVKTQFKNWNVNFLNRSYDFFLHNFKDFFYELQQSAESLELGLTFANVVVNRPVVGHSNQPSLVVVTCYLKFQSLDQLWLSVLHENNPFYGRDILYPLAGRDNFNWKVPKKKQKFSSLVFSSWSRYSRGRSWSSQKVVFRSPVNDSFLKVVRSYPYYSRGAGHSYSQTHWQKSRPFVAGVYGFRLYAWRKLAKTPFQNRGVFYKSDYRYFEEFGVGPSIEDFDFFPFVMKMELSIHYLLRFFLRTLTIQFFFNSQRLRLIPLVRFLPLSRFSTMVLVTLMVKYMLLRESVVTRLAYRLREVPVSDPSDQAILRITGGGLTFRFKRILQKSQLVVGFMLSYRGRFSRRQRALRQRTHFGRIARSSHSSPVEFYQLPVRLANGVCSVRLWTLPAALALLGINLGFLN